jgi:hypothetical protein
MRSILVVGSNVESEKKGFAEFGEHLGKAIIDAGFRLVTGGSADEAHLDLHAAKGAHDSCEKIGRDPDDYLLSVVRHDTEKTHDFGRIQDAMGEGFVAKRLSLIKEANAVITVGGGEGTENYIQLCQQDGKPVVPIPMFGGVSKRHFEGYLTMLPKAVPDFLSTEEFTRINRRLNSEDHRVKAAMGAVELAKKCFSAKNIVFVAIPMSPKFNNVLETIHAAVGQTDYVAARIDEWIIADRPDRIDAKIEKKITESSLFIADLTDLNANVFYEFGFARGHNVNHVLIVENGADLPFDVQSFPMINYDPLDMSKLRDEIQKWLPPTETDEGK